ncbi:MAG TPA: hypothetical protein VJN02_06150 [Gammaproteobacteria bacterium]|nr:hypothetical protein [Gammaproteobacteria bacterium]
MGNNLSKIERLHQECDRYLAHLRREIRRWQKRHPQLNKEFGLNVEFNEAFFKGKVFEPMPLPVITNMINNAINAQNNSSLKSLQKANYSPTDQTANPPAEVSKKDARKRARSDNLILLCRKYDIVYRLNEANIDIDRFNTIWNRDANVLKQHRDSKGNLFLQRVSYILTLGIACVAAMISKNSLIFWKSHGNAFSNRTNKIIQDNSENINIGIGKYPSGTEYNWTNSPGMWSSWTQFIHSTLKSISKKRSRSNTVDTGDDGALRYDADDENNSFNFKKTGNTG